MTVNQAITYGSKILFESGVPDYKLDAQYLLAHVLGFKRLQLILHSDEKLSPENEKEYYGFILQRSQRKPLQYILGTQDFYGREFIVNENVLIPRPETETLCETVIKYVNGRKVSILDLCTGSGAIAVTLALEIKNSLVSASDISSSAISVAKQNASAKNANIKFYCCDLFECLDNLKFNIIVSNPPYIESNVCSTLQSEVMKEPITALDGGKTGFDIINNIIDQAPYHLNNNGALFMEIGDTQGLATKKKFLNYFTNVKIIKDLYNNDRIVCGQLK